MTDFTQVEQRKLFEGTEEEWRRKLQRDWRNKAKDIRKSQLEESLQDESYNMNRSKTFLKHQGDS